MQILFVEEGNSDFHICQSSCLHTCLFTFLPICLLSLIVVSGYLAAYLPAYIPSCLAACLPPIDPSLQIPLERRWSPVPWTPEPELFYFCGEIIHGGRDLGMDYWIIGLA